MTSDIIHCIDCKYSIKDGGYKSKEDAENNLHCKCPKKRISWGFDEIVPKNHYCGYGEQKDQ